MYVGIRGKERLTADREEIAVEADTVVYVKAGVELHFHDVADDLAVGPARIRDGFPAHARRDYLRHGATAAAVARRYGTAAKSR